MFDSVCLWGGAGTLLWGYHEAVHVTSWSIYHHKPDRTHDGRWTLEATFRTVHDDFALRQQPLIFTAPRDKGRWCFPLRRDSLQVGAGRLLATLGPPEQ